MQVANRPIRLRDLEQMLEDRGWKQEANRGGPTRRWKHKGCRKALVFHAPHGTRAAEIRPSMVKQVLNRAQVILRETAIEEGEED